MKPYFFGKVKILRRSRKDPNGCHCVLTIEATCIVRSIFNWIVHVHLFFMFIQDLILVSKSDMRHYPVISMFNPFTYDLLLSLPFYNYKHYMYKVYLCCDTDIMFIGNINLNKCTNQRLHVF